MAIAENKSERIEVRTTSTLKALLQRAAASSHKNVTEFLLEAGINAAKDALVDRRIFRLDDRQWQAPPQRCNTSDPAFYGPPGRGDRVGSDADKLPSSCAGRCRRRVRTAGPTSWRMRTSRVLAPPGRPAFNAMRIRRAQR